MPLTGNKHSDNAAHRKEVNATSNFVDEFILTVVYEHRDKSTHKFYKTLWFNTEGFPEVSE
jgi:hypothetical protein